MSLLHVLIWAASLTAALDGVIEFAVLRQILTSEKSATQVRG